MVVLLFFVVSCPLGAVGNYLVTRISVGGLCCFIWEGAFGSAGNHLVTRDMVGRFCLYYGLEL